MLHETGAHPSPLTFDQRCKDTMRWTGYGYTILEKGLTLGIAIYFSVFTALALGDHKPAKHNARAYRMPIQGIDVSRWQGKIDWTKVKQEQIRFAYIKLTQGDDHLDPFFERNWKESKDAHIPRGAYHFVSWCSSPEAQIELIKRALPKDHGELPIVLDLEWNARTRSCSPKVDRSKILAHMATMINALEAFDHRTVIIYTNATFHRDVLEGNLYLYPHWLRSVHRPPDQFYGDRDWVFWQFTSTGRVKGIQGDVDRNVFNGNEHEWKRLLKTGEVHKPHVVYHKSKAKKRQPPHRNHDESKHAHNTPLEQTTLIKGVRYAYNRFKHNVTNRSRKI